MSAQTTINLIQPKTECVANAMVCLIEKYPGTSQFVGVILTVTAGFIAGILPTIVAHLTRRREENYQTNRIINSSSPILPGLRAAKQSLQTHTTGSISNLRGYLDAIGSAIQGFSKTADELRNITATALRAYLTDLATLQRAVTFAYSQEGDRRAKFAEELQASIDRAEESLAHLERLRSPIWSRGLRRTKRYASSIRPDGYDHQ